VLISGVLGFQSSKCRPPVHCILPGGLSLVSTDLIVSLPRVVSLSGPLPVTSVSNCSCLFTSSVQPRDSAAGAVGADSVAGGPGDVARIAVANARLDI